MTFKTLATAACAAAVALTGATPAFAQAPAAAPAAAAPQVAHGAPITGLCVVSIENAIGASTVGKYVNTRLQQLVGQVNAELSAERTAIDNDAKALEGQRATLDQNALEQRAAALQVRANALQRKAQLRDREIQATEQKAFNRVGTEMEPLIRQAYQAKGCSVLLNRNSIILGNPASDITQQVVTALNAKITQFTFDRERLDQPQPAAPAAAAAPRR
ncbi:OmpH family outer membrane protein [Phenylobacterium kunshanense]|uniref:OmpH family outer membrane protein n=1 Tax=Phenylobacterium kunshanense TaxID=1445034 RepID=A0A328BQR0_9CAUL|nr:OmpH family outer membrane protein [Phenylobacterium kunshanense]RAK68949.1 OmpH family outer membrane protein [Phenylobacterium kunshanense]